MLVKGIMTTMQGASAARGKGQQTRLEEEGRDAYDSKSDLQASSQIHRLHDIEFSYRGLSSVLKSALEQALGDERKRADKGEMHYAYQFVFDQIRGSVPRC
jgi:hypothetical protein